MNRSNFPEPEDWEQRLSGVPLRTPPSAWREQILGAAASASTTDRQTRGRPRQAGWWGDLLWPNPYAWAGVATVWIVILTINHVAGPELPLSLTERAPSGRAAFAFIAHRPQVAELLETEVAPLTPSRPATPPGPRSALATTNQTA